LQGGHEDGISYGYGVAALADDSVVLTGITSGDFAGAGTDMGGSDFAAIKLTSAGVEEWRWQVSKRTTTESRQSMTLGPRVVEAKLLLREGELPTQTTVRIIKTTNKNVSSSINSSEYHHHQQQRNQPPGWNHGGRHLQWGGVRHRWHIRRFRRHHVRQLGKHPCGRRIPGFRRHGYGCQQDRALGVSGMASWRVGIKSRFRVYKFLNQRSNQATRGFVKTVRKI